MKVKCEIQQRKPVFSKHLSLRHLTKEKQSVAPSGESTTIWFEV